jgi:hypothetical protein
MIALCEQIGPQADAELCHGLTGVVFYHFSSGDKAAGRSYSEQCLEVARRLPPGDDWYKAEAFAWVAGLFSA